MAKELISKKLRRAGLVAAASAFLLSGCAYSMSEFAQDRGAGTASASASQDVTGTVPIEPTALVDQDSMPLPLDQNPAATATAAAVSPRAPAPTLYPAPGVPPGQPDSNVLTPEERDRVIAELESLAKSQKVTPPPAPASRCTDPNLSAAERLKREVEGLAC